ncbi:MAG: pilus assembly protein TadG-related protein [Candidatus Dormibacteraceae bacterium]
MIAIVAVAALALIALTGLVVDGGEVTTEHRDAQNAVDAAALAAAIQIANNQQESNATAVATLVAGRDGISTSDLTIAYYDGSGASTGTAANVATIKATIKHAFGTIFLPILGIDSATVGATATATVAHGGGCVICVMDPSASGVLNLANNAELDVVGGPIAVNSSSATAVTLGTNAILNDSSAIDIVGGYQAGGTYTPLPTTGTPAVADPFASAPVPVVTNHPSCCGTTLDPGVYSTISIGNNASVTLNPGIYVITGGISLLNNSSLTGHGVMIYLACSAYPTPCTAGQAGAALTAKNNINLDLSAPSTGTYQGMVIFGDRNNTAGASFGNNGQARFVGSVYLLSGHVDLANNSGGSATDSRIVAASVGMSNNGQLAISFDQSANYVLPNSYTLSG